MLAISLVNAVDFSVVDTTGDSPGGRKFRGEIGGTSYGEQTLRSATDFVWGLFQQTNPSDRRDVKMITLFMENGNGVAYNSNSGKEIHFNGGYLAGKSGDVKREFTGVVYHEVVHSWQWGGPGGLIEGIADYVRLKAGYAPSHWVGPGRGDRWDQGYDVTARFLDYCNDLRNGFVAELNKKMKNGYSDGYFVDLLGKDVNQLWREYKAKYGQ
ncbi:protein family basic secretory protein [Arabidopsis suecica]|uniref:Protein family basic secretory protein n=1 Tax=Arabidopsis suecica TaxID=45249 RepID=A0A8T2BCY1_ARASU|nr:protein family basic secretory protein [Arabidopsis suecica]